MLNKEKLKRYLDANFNVLLEGTHGLGKTAIVKEVFESKGLKWKYFSAATMDPWIDFIGVPKTVNRDGNDVLELIKPKDFANDEVEAIFFDEFNRAPSKVINAVMELIQFKSINGKKFKNLKVIWAAINPYDEEGTYSVEQLDPATKDRFHIQIKIPLELDTGYLIKTYGELSRPFIKWWNELPKDLKVQISPRRLDYAIQVYKAIGDMRDVLSSNSNVKKLEDYIKEMNKGIELSQLEKKTEKELREFFTLENTMRYGEKVLENKKYAYLIKYFHKDFVESNIQKRDGSNFNSLFLKEGIKNQEFFNTLSKKSQEIIELAKNKGILKNVQIDYALEQEIKTVVKENIGRSVKMFMSKLGPIFNKYVISLKSRKSTDIVSFFELVFSVNDNNGLSLRDEIIKTLLNYRTISTYVSQSDNEKMLLGLILNFAIKYQKLDKVSLNGFEEIINNIYKYYIKYKNKSCEKGEMLLISFDESNWLDIKELITKKNDWESVAKTIKVKEMIKNLKQKNENLLKYKEPSSLEKAKDIFCKQELNDLKVKSVKIIELETINV